MRADLLRVVRLLAVASLAVFAAGCSGGEEPVRIGLLTDCRGHVFSGYEDQMLAGAELPLLERGARLTNGKPSGGVSEARVAGRDVELVRGCTEATEFTVLVEEARRLVEVENVDAVVGPVNEADGLVIRELARKHPEVIFIPAWSLAQELTLRHPAANVYRFDTDEAQDVAGLGSYAYRELGWRRAAVITDPFVGWQEAAAFVAEFCALGGNVTSRFENSPAPIDLGDPKVARALQDADGVAAFVFGGLFTSPEFLPTLARTVGSPGTRIVVGTYGLEDSNTVVPIARQPAGVVGASSIPPANATPAMRSHRTAFSKSFPGLPPLDAETPITLAFNDAMEGLLRGLEASDGDLSDGRRRLREELARVRFDVPSGPVHLDRNRQAVRNTYLKRIGRGGGFQLVRVVPGVEQTFGGLLSDAPSPGPVSQPCRKATPPPWVR